MAAESARRPCIAKVTLDEKTVVRRSPEVEHERAVAIFDLVEVEHIADVSARLVVNRAALKTDPEGVGLWVERIREAVDG